MRSINFTAVIAISLFSICTSCRNVPPAVQQEEKRFFVRTVLPQLKKVTAYFEEATTSTMGKVKNRYQNPIEGITKFNAGCNCVPMISPKGTGYWQHISPPEITPNNQEQAINGTTLSAFNKYDRPVVKSVLDYLSANKYVTSSYHPKLDKYVLQTISQTPDVKYNSDVKWDSATKTWQVTASYKASSLDHSKIMTDVAKGGGVVSSGYLLKRFMQKD